jgi:hypothetical protein
MSAKILKSNQEIALILLTRPARTEAGRRVQAALLARVELAIEIEQALAA